MEILNTIFYFIILIGILVLIHEFGHFLAARLTKMRVDVFSFGMGFRLFGWNKKNGFSFGSLGKDWQSDGFTDYRVSLFPIGGYVKIAGMVDESLDTEYASSEPKEWEFRSKNTFQKAFVISAGVIMNALLTVLIFAMIIFIQGEAQRKTTTIGFVEKNSLAYQSGFKSGDKILEINSKPMSTWEECFENLTLTNLGEDKFIKIQRQDSIINIKLDGKKTVKTMAKEEMLGLHPDSTIVIVEAVESLKPASKAGIQRGDTIISINNIPIISAAQLKEMVKENYGKKLYFQWKSGITKADSIAPDTDSLIGVKLSQIYIGQVAIKNYNVLSALYFGVTETIKTINIFFKSIGQIISGTVPIKQAIGGPIMIAQRASQQAELGIIYFLHFTALLSITLAIINIFPFPALDGGHLIFIIIEGIIRREIPVKIKLAFQQVGLTLLLILMAFVIYNDIFR